ncbi:MAG: hypothetical protein R3251_03940 [Candidatus Spechtbacterales bacterium]|nr:hypothetical protein [Candidatus Spechtbacterales bacterium]
MKHFFKSLKKLKKVSMTENEKLYRKEQLLQFMQKNPVKDTAHARHQLSKRGYLFGALQLIPQTKPMAALLIIALLFSFGGGTSLAANDALPGDALYPVKVNINERVEGIFAFNEEAKAEFHLEKAELRLREAEELAEKNEANESNIIKVEYGLEKHIERLEKRADKFEEKGNKAKAEELRARLEAMLEVHTEFLSALQIYLDSLNSELGPEINKIKIEGKENALGRLIIKIESENEEEEEGEDENEDEDEDDEEEDENNGPSQEAALNAQVLVEKRMKMTIDFAKKMNAKTNAEINEEAQSHINSAEELYNEGTAQLEAENYTDAFASFRAAHKEIQRAQSKIAANMGLSFEFDDDDEEDEEEEEEDREENEDEDEEDDEDENEDEDDEEEEDDDDEEEEENEDEDDKEEENSENNTTIESEANITTPFARAWTKTRAKIGF